MDEWGGYLLIEQARVVIFSLGKSCVYTLGIR